MSDENFKKRYGDKHFLEPVIVALIMGFFGSVFGSIMGQKLNERDIQEVSRDLIELKQEMKEAKTEMKEVSATAIQISQSNRLDLDVRTVFMKNTTDTIKEIIILNKEQDAKIISHEIRLQRLENANN